MSLTSGIYADEDLPKVLKLYNETIASSIHFVRNEGFLQYFMRNREASKDGIVICKADDEIYGFAIVSISIEEQVRIGKIIEFQVKDEKAFHALLDAVTKYCMNKNVDAIVLPSPPNVACNAFPKDWIKVDSGVIIAKPLCITSLITAFLDQNTLSHSILKSVTVTLNVDGEFIEINLTPTSLNVKEVYEIKKKSILIKLPSQTLIDIMFCRSDPIFLLLKGKIKVNSFKNLRTILKLLRAFRIKRQLYFSLSDRL